MLDLELSCGKGKGDCAGRDWCEPLYRLQRRPASSLCLSLCRGCFTDAFVVERGPGPPGQTQLLDLITPPVQRAERDVVHNYTNLV
jgi:hypothetical protein